MLSNEIENKCLCSFLVLFSYISDHLRGQNMDKSLSLFTSSTVGRKLAFEGFTYNKETRKTTDIYQQTFLAMSCSVSVTVHRTDFEDACIKAYFQKQPLTMLLFHLAKAHWRKVGDLGLRQQYMYLSDEEFATVIRMFTALAFLSPDAVYTVFAELCESIPKSAHCFIEDTYVGCYRFSSRTKPD